MTRTNAVYINQRRPASERPRSSGVKVIDCTCDVCGKTGCQTMHGDGPTSRFEFKDTTCRNCDQEWGEHAIPASALGVERHDPHLSLSCLRGQLLRRQGRAVS